jgi:hypothetical protein
MHFVYTMLPLTQFTRAAARTRPQSLLSNLRSSILGLRGFAASVMVQDPFKPAARVAGQRQDVW